MATDELNDPNTTSVQDSGNDEGFQTVTNRRNKGKTPKGGVPKFVPIRNIYKNAKIGVSKGGGGAPQCSSLGDQ